MYSPISSSTPGNARLPAWLSKEEAPTQCGGYETFKLGKVTGNSGSAAPASLGFFEAVFDLRFAFGCRGVYTTKIY